MSLIIGDLMQSIRVKASLYVVVLITATTLVFYLIAMQIMDSYIQAEVLKRADSLSNGIGSTAGYSFMSGDMLGLDNMVYRIKDANKDVEYIAITDPDMKTIVHSDMNKEGQRMSRAAGKVLREGQNGSVIREAFSASGKIFELSSPIVFMKKNLGFVIMGINKSVFIDVQKTVQKRIMVIFAVILFIGILGSVIISSFLTRPIKELSSGVEELKKGVGVNPLMVYSRDELGRLTESFNEMTALITTQRGEIAQYARDLEEAYISTIRVLAAAIDARDSYTLGHSTRVSRLSTMIGREIGLTVKELEELEMACLFHDVGKIKTPDAILRKNICLNESEQTEMMRHTEYGAQILSKAPSLHRFIPPVRHHHEWFNGQGYPDGLSGEDIPLFAAIISVADSFDAMTSDRPYRKALSKEEAKRELLSFTGRQFDPVLIDAFMKVIEDQSARTLSHLVAA